jgi:hypothetical protein
VIERREEEIREMVQKVLHMADDMNPENPYACGWTSACEWIARELDGTNPDPGPPFPLINGGGW